MAIKGKSIPLLPQPSQPPPRFHAWLRQQRQIRKLSQKALEKEINYSQSYISDIENEVKPASDGFKKAVEKFFKQ